MKRRRRFAAAALAVSGMIFIYLGLSFKEVPLTGHELKYQVYNDLAGYAPAADYSEETGIININSAGVDELMLLEGIGETKAKAIVEYRNANGYFRDVSELSNVNGIGEKTLEKIREKCTV